MKLENGRKTLIVAALVGATVLSVAAIAYAQSGGYGPRGMMGGGGGPGGMMGWSGPGGGQGTMMGGASFVRRRYVMANGIDPAYAQASNPLAPTPENIAAGKTIFESACAACHGPSGRGDGPAAKGLNPPPADLASALRTPMVTDAYLAWTISEGGIPVGSAMPPFKATITGDKLWKLILYLRTL